MSHFGLPSTKDTLTLVQDQLRVTNMVSTQAHNMGGEGERTGFVQTQEYKIMGASLVICNYGN